MDDKTLLLPYDYVAESRSKRVITTLIEAFNLWLEVPQEICTTVCKIVDMLHDAALLMDDIEDNSVLRHGKPAAHTVFGNSATINGANLAYFLSLEKILKELPTEQTSEAVKIFTEFALCLHRAQGMDIYWRENLICPSEELYRVMIRKKSGAFLDLGVKLMQLFSKDKRNYSKLVSLLSEFLEIGTDYCMLTAKEHADNKIAYNCLTEGKFSFPIIHAIKAKPEDLTLINILKQRTEDVELRRFAVNFMERLGSLKYTRKVILMVYDEAKSESERLGVNKSIYNALDALVNKFTES